MSLRLLAVLAALVAAPVLAGCASPASLLGKSSVVPALDLLSAPEALWPDHQNEPHPLFGWPTLTHPATGAGVPTFWEPIPNATLPAKVTGLAAVARAPDAVSRGAGTSIFGSLAIVPGFGESSSILDIRDPTHPQLLGQTEKSNVSHRGSAVIAFPNGTLIALFSTSYGMQAFDITDPTKPTLTSDVHLQRGHKLGVVPGTPIVYNANSMGGNATLAPGVNDPRNNEGMGQGVTEILDFSDPWNPVLVQSFKNGYGCHHIFFWIDASKDKYRAICSGIQYTQLWDIKDPKAPKVIVSVPMHHGNTMLPSTAVSQGVPGAPVRVLTFSHTAMLNQDGTILIAGDEFQGGGGPAECDGVHTPLRDTSGPLGNLWFYDVKDEKSPKLLGWISPTPKNLPAADVADGCTAHHGRLVPDPEGKRQLLVMAWYKAGVVLVDFTDATAPRIVDQFDQGTNTWEAWYDHGWIFTGDLARGLDVLRLK